MQLIKQNFTHKSFFFTQINLIIRFDPNFLPPLQRGRLSVVCDEGTVILKIQLQEKLQSRGLRFLGYFYNVPLPPKVYIDTLLMCIILGMYTWQLKNGEAVVTSQTTWVSARAYMWTLLHRRNKLHKLR